MRLFTRNKDFYKRFFALTFTIAMQNLLVFSVNLADNLMLGRYNEDALSGVALANQIQFLLQMIIMGVGEGVVVMGARYWGERNTEAIRKIINIGLKVAILAGALLWMVVFFFPEFCLGLLTDDLNVIAEGCQYLKIICFSYIIFSVSSLLLSALRSVETVNIGFAVSAVALVINVVLNYLLIYGNFGAPRLGVQGAAVATLISRVVELAIVIGYLVWKDRKLQLKWNSFGAIDRSYIRGYIKVGLPLIISNGIWGIAQGMQTSILGHIGGEAIAANSVATTIFQILTVVTYGAASAAAVVIGKTIGEKLLDLVKEYAITLQFIFLGIGVVTGALLFVLRNPILSLYEITHEARQLASDFMLVLSVTVVGTSYQMACNTGIIRGGGDTKFILYLDIIAMWGVVLPAAAISAFVFEFPPVVVFCCLKCDQIWKCFVSVVKVNRFRWIKSIQ